MTLSGPDRKDLVVPHAGSAEQGGVAVWQGQSAEGATVTVTVAVKACSDGMSDLAYPYSATVEAAGETLQGCAAPADDWPKPVAAP